MQHTIKSGNDKILFSRVDLSVFFINCEPEASPLLMTPQKLSTKQC